MRSDRTENAGLIRFYPAGPICLPESFRKD
jgi:hypothetical protein